MEDLTGLNFTPSLSTQPKSDPGNQTPLPPHRDYVSPIPSRSFSPNYNIPLSQSNGGPKGSLPHNSTASKLDSFASLSAISGITRQHAQNLNASLEQQRLAREKEKRDALEKEKRDLDLHFGADEFWEKHSRQNTPSITTTDTYILGMLV